MTRNRTRAGVARRTTQALAGGACVALALTACGGGGGASASSSSSGGVTTITVGLPPAVTADAVLIAQEKGFFSQHHLKVNVETINGGAGAVPALQSGALQVAQSNVLSEIQGAAHGLAVPCFAGAFALQKTSGKGFIPLVAGADSGITKASDLTGKTIAVNATGGVNQLMTDAWLDGRGVDYKSIHYQGMEFPNMPQAISAGRVPAAVGTEPFGTQMVQQGATLLTGDLESNITGRPIFSCWNASSDWLKQNAGTARNFIAAIKQANDFINTQPDQFQTWLQKNSKIAPDVIKDLSLPQFTTSMSDKDVTEWQDAANKYGILTGSDVDAAKVYQPVTGG
jgi:NitT/TauT family transport system substrate-binding protein